MCRPRRNRDDGGEETASRVRAQKTPRSRLRRSRSGFVYCGLVDRRGRIRQSADLSHARRSGKNAGRRTYERAVLARLCGEFGAQFAFVLHGCFGGTALGLGGAGLAPASPNFDAYRGHLAQCAHHERDLAVGAVDERRRHARCGGGTGDLSRVVQRDRRAALRFARGTARNGQAVRRRG